LDEFYALAEGRRITLLTFNKDARTLLRGFASGICAVDCELRHLIDFTLPYRPRVHALAQDLLPQRQIITSPSAFAELLDAPDDERPDMVLCFDAGYERMWPYVEADGAEATDDARDQEPEVVTFGQAAERLRRDYQAYAARAENAEFNFRWSQEVVQFLVAEVTSRRILMAHAYNEGLHSVNARDDFLLQVDLPHRMLGNVPADLAKVPVRFIVGEDWGCGKTSYLLNRMREGAYGIAGDFWFSLLSRGVVPEVSAEQVFYFKGVLANLIAKSAREDPTRPVFIKFDGRLEEFVYGFPRDRTYMIKDMHRYFDDCEVHIVHKTESSHDRMPQLVAAFQRKYELSFAQIRRVRMSYDARECLVKDG
jgi:hypothetical protein